MTKLEVLAWPDEDKERWLETALRLMLSSKISQEQAEWIAYILVADEHPIQPLQQGKHTRLGM